MKCEITVLRTGFAAIQDLGRNGFEYLGIAVNGAGDQLAAEVANTLVGNVATAPVIEILASDFVIQGTVPLLVAVTGAPATIMVNGVRRGMWEPLCLEPGQQVAVTRVEHGLRCYLAVAGELAAPSVMGSCAPDSLLGVGRHLSAGDAIELDTDYTAIGRGSCLGPLFVLHPPVPRYGTHWRIPITEGPDLTDYDDGFRHLHGTTYRVGVRSNHIGLRLEGDVPARRVTHEILSRGVPVGAIEAPPDDGLLALARGRPVTAGYPVLAVATHEGRRVLGQAAPGHSIQFQPTTLEEAIAEHQRTLHALTDLRQRVRTAFDAVGIPTRFTPGKKDVPHEPHRTTA